MYNLELCFWFCPFPVKSNESSSSGYMGRMEISSVLRMKRGNGNFKKKFFFIFKLLFKNPEKKKWLERGKKSVSREIYCPLYLGIYFNLLAISHYIMSLWGQNHGLLLFLCGEGTLCYVFNQICWINEWIQLTSLPSLTFLVKSGRGQINKNT